MLRVCNTCSIEESSRSVLIVLDSSAAERHDDALSAAARNVNHGNWSPEGFEWGDGIFKPFGFKVNRDGEHSRVKER